MQLFHVFMCEHLQQQKVRSSKQKQNIRMNQTSPESERSHSSRTETVRLWASRQVCIFVFLHTYVIMGERHTKCLGLHVGMLKSCTGSYNQDRTQFYSTITPATDLTEWTSAFFVSSNFVLTKVNEFRGGAVRESMWCKSVEGTWTWSLLLAV